MNKTVKLIYFGMTADNFTTPSAFSDLIVKKYAQGHEADTSILYMRVWYANLCSTKDDSSSSNNHLNSCKIIHCKGRSYHCNAKADACTSFMCFPIEYITFEAQQPRNDWMHARHKRTSYLPDCVFHHCFHQHSYVQCIPSVHYLLHIIVSSM